MHTGKLSIHIETSKLKLYKHMICVVYIYLIWTFIFLRVPRVCIMDSFPERLLFAAFSLMLSDPSFSSCLFNFRKHPKLCTVICVNSRASPRNTVHYFWIFSSSSNAPRCSRIIFRSLDTTGSEGKFWIFKSIIPAQRVPAFHSGSPL